MQTKRYIIIIDNDTELCKILGSFLNTQGISVFSSASVSSALKKLDKQRYNCILIDPALKGESIESLLTHLGEIGNLNIKTPIICYSADMAVEMSIQNGKRISEVIQKPFSLEELAFKIQKVAA